MRRLILIAAVLNICCVTWADDWPGWRGPKGAGVSSEKGVVSSWSTSDNITWKVPMPGPGNSSPIVWGDRVFVSGALEKGTKRTLMCFSRTDGKKHWQQAIAYTKKETTHKGNPYCSSTPVTDGKIVVAALGSAEV